MMLKNKNLLCNRCFINGSWQDADQAVEVRNPATGELLGTVPFLGLKETRQAVAAAEEDSGDEG